MKQFILRKTKDDSEISFIGFSWELSKGEKHYLFQCERDNKILERSFPVYDFYLWESIEIDEVNDT